MFNYLIDKVKTHLKNILFFDYLNLNMFAHDQEGVLAWWPCSRCGATALSVKDYNCTQSLPASALQRATRILFFSFYNTFLL